MAIQTTGVGVLDRAVAILDVIEAEPMRASDLARRLGLSVPTAHRLVAAMVAHGLLRRDDDGLHYMGRRFASSMLSVVATPLIRELAAATGETVQIWVPRGEGRLCLASVDSTAELRATLPVGTMLPLTAGGSAAKVLGREVSSESRSGRFWDESISERTPGLCSVSAPVHSHGEVIAAVCLAAPVARVGAEGPGVRFGDQVVATAKRLATILE